MNNNLNIHEIDEEYITNELHSVVLSMHNSNKEIALGDTIYVNPYNGCECPILVKLGDFLEANDLLPIGE